MKTLKPIFIAIILFIFLTSCEDSNAKKPEEAIVPKVEAAIAKKDTVKQMNLLDEQAKMLSKVFGNVDTEEGRALKDVDSYLDLVEQANFPPDIKKTILDQYKLYELSLNPRKKDSLKLVFNEKLSEAMAKSMENPN
ncbi:hypothetical protein ACOCEA_17330 [Maribacter sp. CXY002]|uniref:hypothetical protein n=1 Tax=Maribacter luteocoastalis TaxID=3407671 RepID=UPI003B674936